MLRRDNLRSLVYTTTQYQYDNYGIIVKDIINVINSAIKKSEDFPITVKIICKPKGIELLAELYRNVGWSVSYEAIVTDEQEYTFIINGEQP